MEITEIGDVYELKREQWKGNSARISKDPKLLEEVNNYTWTYSEGNHPYLRCSKIGMSLHKFVLGFIYGYDNIDKMLAEGNIIEHLDNNGLNCTYENLHILSEDMNKAKAFSIDKMNKEEVSFPAYIMDVYYLHDKKLFQMQIFMNDDLYFNPQTNNPVEMFVCMYNEFDMLYLDWFYLLKCRLKRKFDREKLHENLFAFSERPLIKVKPEEINSPLIERNGIYYLNLDAQIDGKPVSRLQHTSLRKIIIPDEVLNDIMKKNE